MNSSGDPLSGSDPLERRRRGRRSLWGGVIVTALLAALLLGGAIVSVPLAATAGAWFGRLGGHGCGHARHGHGDPERMREHLDFAAGWVLRRIDGTDEQRQQVVATLEGFIDQVHPLAEQHRAHRDSLLAELSRPSIDREAIQELRRAEMELAQIVSTQLVDALTDVAQILTPEQRLELIELAKQHHRHH